MSSKTYLKILLASFLLGIGISMVGCGSSGGGGPAANVSSQIVANGETPNNCINGYVDRALDGAQVCHVVTDYEFRGYSDPYVALLSPSNPNASTALPFLVALLPAMPVPMAEPVIMPMQMPRLVQLEVQPNDKITFLSVSGSLGRLTESGGFFKKVTCEKYLDIYGRRADGVELKNEELSSGLFISNGRAIYPAFGPKSPDPKKSSSIFINEAGPLSYGFNASVGTGDCHSVYMRFKLERCLDAASMPHRCAQLRRGSFGI
jgi:hypothetical protein